MIAITELLQSTAERKASDLHITVGVPVTIRVNGELQWLTDAPLTAEDTHAMVRALMDERQWNRLAEHGELDFPYSLPSVARFRVNVYRQRGCYSIAARVVPSEVPDFETLGLPESVRAFASRDRGLVLVTGPTGSGKSTTLASLIKHINQTQRKRIITLEDPIEYLHRHEQSLVDQREVGVDTQTFASGLRAALRQDPDVLLVGEMRDLETISVAITAAETGHLVFSTLHTADAAQAVDRIIDVFPPEQQSQIRIQLASALVGVVAQRLLPTADVTGRVAAAEVLVNTPAVANLIRTEKGHQIRTAMQTGRAYGMRTMEMSLRELLQQHQITETQYHAVSAEPSALTMTL